MLLLAQALHAVYPGIVVISGICPSYKRLCHLESTLSIRNRVERLAFRPRKSLIFGAF